MPRNDARAFGRKLKRWHRKQVVQRLPLEIEKVTNEAGEYLVNNSPVDSGQFRANWRGAVGKPSGLFRFGKGSKAAALRSIRAAAKRARIGQTVFVSNAAVYTKKLEDKYGLIRGVVQFLRGRYR